MRQRRRGDGSFITQPPALGGTPCHYYLHRRPCCHRPHIFYRAGPEIFRARGKIRTLGSLIGNKKIIINMFVFRSITLSDPN